MTQEEKQLLLKDLCARLPYGVKCRQRKLDSQVCTMRPEYLKNVEDVEKYESYLRPMSSMTEEEFKMVCSMNALTDTELSDRIKFPNMFVKSYTIETFDLFNSHHFDYRGLIPMGLALEAKEEMYKTV